MIKKDDTDNTALKSGVWYVISSVTVNAISIITTPIFTRILTTEEYGITATFTSWYSLLIIFSSLNLAFSIGRAKLDYPDKLNDYIGSMQLLSGIFTFFLFLATLIFIRPISLWTELDKPFIFLLILYLFFMPAISFKQNGLRYQYKYKQNIAIAWYMAISTVLLSLVFVLSQDENKALWYITGLVVPAIVLSAAFWLNALRKKEMHINLGYWKYGLFLSLPLILHSVSKNVLAQSDRILISKLCSPSATGIYNLAYSYALALSIITSAISESWLPWFHDSFFAGNHHAIRQNVKSIIILGCYIGLACIALAPEAIYILGGANYMEGISCVPPLVLGIICQYIYTHYVNIELHLKKTKYVSGGTILAAAINIILNFIFIPLTGYVAAAYTTLASYLILMIIHLLITEKLLKVKLYDDRFMFGALGMTSIIAIILVFSYQHTIVRYSLVAIGFCTFCLFAKSTLHIMRMK